MESSETPRQAEYAASVDGQCHASAYRIIGELERELQEADLRAAAQASGTPCQQGSSPAPEQPPLRSTVPDLPAAAALPSPAPDEREALAEMRDLNESELMNMSTSQTAPVWTDILNADEYSKKAIGYFRERLGVRLHQMILNEFLRMEKRGFKRAHLAKRIRKDPAQITRLLGSPGNWTIDTVSDLLLGMGYEPELSLRPIHAPNVPAVSEKAGE